MRLYRYKMVGGLLIAQEERSIHEISSFRTMSRCRREHQLRRRGTICLLCMSVLGGL